MPFTSLATVLLQRLPIGFGHATRTFHIAETLVAQGHSLTITTLAPSFIFFPFSVRTSPTLDPGVYQADAFKINVEKTLDQLSLFLSHPLRDSWILSESEYLIKEGFDLVYLDAPFLPALAAKVHTICVEFTL